MNKLLGIVIGAMLALGAALPSEAAITAAGNNSTIWAGGSTNGATTLSWVIVPAESRNNGVPLVTSLSAISDKAGSVVQSYKCTRATSCNYGGATISIPVVATNGFTVSDVIIIRHAATATYEKRILDTFTSATNLTTTVAPMVATAVGDLIYRVTTTGAAKIPVGAATLSVNNAGGIIAGERVPPSQGPDVVAPLLLEVDATTTGTLYAVGVAYVP